MDARAIHFRRRLAIAVAVGTAFAAGGCQAILGIDPDARHDADGSGLLDGSFIDGASDAPLPDAHADAASEAGATCNIDDDCASLAHAACEKGVCTNGKCALVSRDGEKISTLGGTCSGYACISDLTTLAASGDTTCISAADGLVWCWGSDANGLLGDDETSARSTPYLVPRIGDDLAGAIMVSVGDDHACAVLTNQTVVCWGANDFGQSTGADAGTTPSAIGPSEVHSAPQSTWVAPIAGSTCVLSAEQNVWCWGDNSVGQLGLGSAAPSSVSTPNRIDLLAQRFKLSGSAKTMCASANEGLDVACWGDNTWGQLGTACAGTSCSSPIMVAGVGSDSGVPPDIAALATGWGNVCIVSDPPGLPQCWGNDRAGQLGDGRGVDFFGDGGSGDQPNASPGIVVNPDGGDQPVVAFGILGSATHFCAQTLPDRNFICWGESSDGELGAGPDFFPTPFHAAVFDRALHVVLGAHHACMLFGDAAGYHVSCLGRGQAGQLGDALPITEHDQKTPTSVKFPSTPGGVAVLRAHQ